MLSQVVLIETDEGATVWCSFDIRINKVYYILQRKTAAQTQETPISV